MFNDIGKKIKNWAKFVCWTGIIMSVIYAIIMFVMVGEAPYGTEVFYFGLGIAFLFVGPLLSWIGSFFVYGFGELIDKICDIERNILI